MMTNNTPTELQKSEVAVSSQNQLTFQSTNNGVAHVSDLSSSDESISSDEEDDKQVAEIPQALTGNGLKIASTFSDCKGVNSTVHNSTIYKDAVTVNNNFYCCSFSLESVLKWCKERRRMLLITLVLGISLIILLAVLLSIIRTSNESNNGPTETIPQTTTTDVPPITTSSTTSTTESLQLTNTTDVPHNETEPETSTTELPLSTTDPTTTSTVLSSTESSTSTTTTILSTSTEASTSSTPESPENEWKIVSRKEWGAQLYNHMPKKFPFLPPSYVIMSETETKPCNKTTKCMEIVHEIQATELENPMKADIAYNFLVGSDGMAYECRGWNVHADVGDYDTEYFDHISIRIAFIGKFDTEEPTETILQSAKTLLKFGVENKKLSEEYKFMCVGQLSKTIENPGDKLYNVLKKWKRWDSRTIEAFPPIGFPENWPSDD